MKGMPTELTAVDQDQAAEMEPYERLLTDAMRGDALLFVRQDAVEAAWAIVNPVLDDVVPVHSYAPGSWGPGEAERLASDICGWHNPGEAGAPESAD
jgi:glucose-6-phosphate 1-dehydrogenase